VIFRSIEKWEPTILADEADNAFKNDILREIYNSGWVRGEGVPRCDPPDYSPHWYPTFCAKALGMIGHKMKFATLTRCIILDLKRKKPSERVEHFNHRDDPGLAVLRQQALRWTIDNVTALKATVEAATTKLPAGFDNRLGDNWRLLLAIADMAGGEWPERARRASASVSKVVDTVSTQTQALADIRALFEANGGTDKLTSAQIVTAFQSMEDRPWADWKGGKPITANGLARLLKPFGIVPGTIRLDTGATAKGYHRAQFEDAFARYLGESEF